MYTQFLLTAASLLCATAAQKLKIMPLGDSITEITCWRAKLWDHLSDANVTSNIQFVGSMTDNPLNCTAADSDWDHHHEGHSGYLAINIANLFLASWLENAQPDVVMFMLGTNDVGSNFSTSAIIAAYTKMVQEMRSSNPNTTIIIDTVIPFPLRQSSVNALNSAIPSWAESQNTTTSPIYVADIAAVYPQGNIDLRDGVHPNDAGDVVIADVLAPVLTSVIKSKTKSSKKSSNKSSTASSLVWGWRIQLISLYLVITMV